MSGKEESAAQKAARLRRERRAKIQTGGSERLQRITGLSGRPASFGKSGMVIRLSFGISIWWILNDRCCHRTRCISIPTSLRAILTRTPYAHYRTTTASTPTSSLRLASPSPAYPKSRRPVSGKFKSAGGVSKSAPSLASIPRRHWPSSSAEPTRSHRETPQCVPGRPKWHIWRHT